MPRSSAPTSPRPKAADLNRFLQRRADLFQGFEPWVKCDVGADYLGIHPKTLEKLARQGDVPAHPVCSGKRSSWHFLISELDAWMRARVST